MRSRQTALRHVAGWLIAASVLAGLCAIAVRAGWGGVPAHTLEGTTLFLAAAAYLAHTIAHHEHARELFTRSILVSAFALWGIVQIAPAVSWRPAKPVAASTAGNGCPGAGLRGVDGS